MEDKKVLNVIGDNNIKRLAKFMVPKYYALVKSEEIAKDVLEENGLRFNSELLNDRKKRYEDFLDYIEVKGLDDCVEDVTYEVSINDVVTRIDEQASYEIGVIEKAYEDGDPDYVYLEIGTVIYDLIRKYDSIKEEYVRANRCKKRQR